MEQRHQYYSPYQPQLGCLLLLLTLMLLCLAPLFLLEAAQLALTKLHLDPAVALLVLMGIIVGGMVNLPVYVIERPFAQPFPSNRLHSLMGWTPIIHRQARRTIIAVNVGGCLIPAALAVFEAGLVISAAPQAVRAMVAASAINIALCYYVARPVEGIGIAMPAFASPAASVLATWLLLMGDEFAMIRAPVAFVAGVSGPLIGADLLNLRHMTKLAAPVMSIGGAGTFDGIVLSGMLAAFLV